MSLIYKSVHTQTLQVRWDLSPEEEPVVDEGEATRMGKQLRDENQSRRSRGA